MAKRQNQKPDRPDRSKDFFGTWKRLIRYIRRHLVVVVLALVFAFAGTILTLLGPAKLRDITNLITAGMATEIDMAAIARIGVLLIGLYVAGMLLSVAQGAIMATVTERVANRMRGDISKKINRLPMWFYNRTTTGDILSRVTNDVDTIAESLNMSVSDLVTSATLMIGSLVMMLLNNPIMTATAVAATIIGFGLMSLIMGRSQKFFVRQQKHLGEINGHVEEIYTGHTVVKAYNGERSARAAFLQMNESLRDSSFRAQCLSGMMPPLMGFIGNFGYVAVCVVGAVLVFNGKADFGTIVAFMIYIRYFTRPLSQIAQSMQSMQAAAAAGERVFEFLDAEELSDESGKQSVLPQTRGLVEFDHVRFGYEDSDKTVIHDFSAVAKPGQKVAIVGPTGAGKTTIVNLLMRFYDIQKGQILIDGEDISKLSRADTRRRFGMVLQDTWLFKGTVAENVAYGSPEATREEIERACDLAYCDHFIRRLPQGYDSVISEDSTAVSSGQKQLLTIARALLADRSLLILDEATSNVDTRTELLIQKAMDRLMGGRTCFVIAHRLSTIVDADCILVIRDGQIVEQGTHRELLDQKGFYYKLFNSQYKI